MLAGKGCQDTIRNARRQLIGPFINSLVGDADGGCSAADGPAEQFDGLGFQHGAIEPQLNEWCNLSSFNSCDHETMVEIGKRLEAAMAARGLEVAAVARGTKMTYQGVQKIVEGNTKFMKPVTRDKLAAFLNISPTWLESGKGQMEPSAAEAVQLQPRVITESQWALIQDFEMLPEEDKKDLRDALSAKAMHVRRIVSDYLERQGVTGSAKDSRVEETYGLPSDHPTTKE